MFDSGDSARPSANQPAPNLHTAAVRSKSWSGLLGVILLALVIRGLLCAEPACIDRNGVILIRFAKRLADDPVRWMKVTTKQPGFSFLLLGTHRLFGPMLGGQTPESWQRCGELLALLGGVTVCGAIYLLTKRLFNDEIAVVAGIFASFWPQAAHLSAQALSDMPHLALYLIALLLAYEALMRRRIWLLALCGVTAGMAYLIRQEALGLIPAVLACWLWPTTRRSWRMKTAGAAILVLCFIATVAPYSLAVGRMIPNKGPQDLFDRLFSLSRSTGQFPMLMAFMIPWWQAPIRCLGSWAWSGRYVFSSLFLLSLILKDAPRAEAQGRRLISFALVIHFILLQVRVATFGETSIRYALLFAGLCIPWAAMAFVHIMSILVGRMQYPSSFPYAASWTIGYIAALLPLVYYLARPVNHGSEDYRIAGLWLREHANAGDYILAHEHLEQIMFYAGRIYPDQTWIKCHRKDPLDKIQRIIQKRRPSWFVDAENSHKGEIDEQQHFERLLNDTMLQHVPYHFIGPTNRKVHIYRLDSPVTSDPANDLRHG